MHQARASIFAFLNTHQVLFGQHLQVAGKGRPVHNQDPGQAFDRDWRRLAKRGKQGKLCDVEATWGQDFVVELGEDTISAPNRCAGAASHLVDSNLVAHTLSP